MRLILKIASLCIALILVFASFYLAGSGQDSYFYAACGFALAGILVFIMFMREKKHENAQKKEAQPAPETITEEK